MNYLQVRNWPRFQHYKDRNPPWIKLYTELQGKWEWVTLPDTAKAHLVGLWMLAAQMGNRIPDDPGFIASKIGAMSVKDVARSLEWLKAAERGPFIEPSAVARSGSAPGVLAEAGQKRSGPFSPHTPLSRETERQKSPPSPRSGGGAALSGAELRDAVDELAVAFVAGGGRATREWRRAIREQLRAGDTEEQLLARIVRQGEERAAVNAGRAAAEAWVEEHGGADVVAQEALSWAARNAGDGEHEVRALTRWAADKPDGVFALLAGPLYLLRRERDVAARAHGPPPADERGGGPDSQSQEE